MVLPFQTQRKATQGCQQGDPEVQFISTITVYFLSEMVFTGTHSRSFPGEDGESFSAGDVSMFDMGLHKDEGSNLVDSKPFVAIQAPTLLDLPRNPLNRGLFESFTYTGTLCRKIPASVPLCQHLAIFFSLLKISTGISCSFLKIKPFSLRPRSRYMLEVTASKFGMATYRPAQARVIRDL